MVGLLCLPKTLWQKMHKRACFILLELAMKTLTRPQLLCFFEAKLKKYKPLPKTIGLSHFLEIYRLRSTSGGNSRIWSSGKILYVAVGQLKGGKHGAPGFGPHQRRGSADLKAGGRGGCNSDDRARSAAGCFRRLGPFM